MNDAVKAKTITTLENIASKFPEVKQEQNKDIQLLQSEFDKITKFIGLQVGLSERVALKNIQNCPELNQLTETMKNISGDGNTANDYEADVVWNVQANAKAFLEVMHKYNASTDIGTIQYLDNFAKSNTTDFMCIQTTVADSKYTVPYSQFMEDLHKNQS